MTTLYEINKELLELVNNYESNVENATDEVVEFQNDMFEKLNLQFNDKIKNVAMVMREKEGEATIIDNEIKRLLALKTNKLNTVEKLKNYISRALQSQGIEKLDLDIFKFSFRPSEQMKVTEEGEKLLPNELVCYKLDDNLDKSQSEELIELGYNISIVSKGLPEIKKWFKGLEKQREEQTNTIIKEYSNGDISRDEHDEKLKIIEEQKKEFKDRIRIEKKQNLQIK